LGQNVAYTSTIGLQTQGTEQQTTRVAGSGKDVADSEGFHAQRCHNRQRKGEPWGKGRGPTQSRLGRGTDGPADWLDGCRWPAPLGQPQYEWEPPRVINGAKNRVPRLKALGNAVVPQQVYPIFKAIAEIEKS